MTTERITQTQLADALKGMRLAIRTGESAEGNLVLVNGEIHVPDNVALHVFRTVNAHAAPVADAPSYASRAGTVLSLADKVVDLLDRESERSIKRTLRWVWDYLTDGDEPPF